MSLEPPSIDIAMKVRHAEMSPITCMSVMGIHPARAARKVETTWAFPAAAAPLLRLGLGPVPVDEIAWILFRRTWVEPRT